MKREDIMSLLAELRKRFGGKSWYPVLEAEIISDLVAEKIEGRIERRLEEMFARIPRPERFRPYYQPPFEKVVSANKVHEFLRVERKGSLLEFSLMTTSTNFRVYVERDTDVLLQGTSFSQLVDISPSIAWVTAVQKPEGDYWLQIAGLDFDKKLVVAVETLEEIRFYNVSWTYLIIY